MRDTVALNDKACWSHGGSQFCAAGRGGGGNGGMGLANNPGGHGCGVQPDLAGRSKKHLSYMFVDHISWRKSSHTFYTASSTFPTKSNGVYL